MRLTAIALIVASAGFVPAHASSQVDGGGAPGRGAAASRPVVAGSKNVLSGTQAGFLTIRIPKRVVFSRDQRSNSDFEVRGPGLFAGFFLQSDGAEKTGLLGGRLPSGGAFGPPGEKEILLPFGEISEEGYVLERGDYRLYLIADGPTEVTLHFRGLRGVRNLHPDHETSMALTKLPVRSVEGQNNLYSAGAVSDLDSEGLIFQYLSVKSSAWGAGEYGNCIAPEQADEPPPSAWLPFCPLAQDAVTTTIQDAFVRLDSRLGFYTGTLGLPAGRYAASMWYEAAAVVEEAAAITMWFSLT